MVTQRANLQSNKPERRFAIRKFSISALLGSVTLAALLLAPTAASQTATAPQFDSATLRAQLAPTMGRVDVPMPADVGSLDKMLQQEDFGPLTKRLREAQEPAAIEVDLNWEQNRLYNGAGFIIANAYMYDLWRLGTALPGTGGDGLKGSAAMMFVYSFDLVSVDGVKCSDQSAPGHRMDQLFTQNGPIVAYLRTLPRVTRMAIGSISLGVETATAPFRKNDGVICSGGLAEIAQGLKSQGTKPLQQMPNAPGTIGKTFAVPSAPDYKPQFVSATVWQAKQATARQSLPVLLTRLLSLPTDTPAVPPKK